MNKATTRRAEQSAAWAVMRADRRFLWFWAGVAAAASLAGNLGHAWVIRASTEPPLWMSYGWAVVPVILLMLSAYAKPTLKRMLTVGRGEGIGDDGQDRISSVVVWVVFVGAFVWSALGIYAFTVALGTPPEVAWIAPATIDVALFGALRGLVLTAPIAARMKVGAADAAPTPVIQRAAPVPAPAPVRADAMVVLPASTVSTGGEALGEAPPRESQVAAVVPHHHDAYGESPALPVVAATDAPPVTQEHRDHAAILVRRGTVAKPVEEIAAVLAAWEAGVSERRISTTTGWSTNTIRKLRRDAAAAESIPA